MLEKNTPTFCRPLIGLSGPLNPIQTRKRKLGNCVLGSCQMHLENELKSNYHINVIMMLQYVTLVDEQEQTIQRLTKCE